MLLIRRAQLAERTYPVCCLCGAHVHPNSMRGDACAWCIQIAGCASCGATCIVGTMRNGPQGNRVCGECAGEDAPDDRTPDEDEEVALQREMMVEAGHARLDSIDWARDGDTRHFYDD